MIARAVDWIPDKAIRSFWTLKALLKAMLEPVARLREREAAADYTGRLALQEETKGLPWGIVWDQYCATAGVAGGPHWLDELRAYEKGVLASRS